MGFSTSDVVPFTQARANLSELAQQEIGRASCRERVCLYV